LQASQVKDQQAAGRLQLAASQIVELVETVQVVETVTSAHSQKVVN
jgi:hypothetical protein